MNIIYTANERIGKPTKPLYYFLLNRDIIHPLDGVIAERGDVITHAFMQNLTETVGIDNIDAVVCTDLHSARVMYIRMMEVA